MHEPTKPISYDSEDINFDDIPEITDFTGWVKNPHYGKFIKDGKFTVQVHCADHTKLQEIEAATGKVLSSKRIVEERRLAI